jgi:hypothetical protein
MHYLRVSRKLIAQELTVVFAVIIATTIAALAPSPHGRMGNISNNDRRRSKANYIRIGKSKHGTAIFTLCCSGSLFFMLLMVRAIDAGKRLSIVNTCDV